MTTQSETTLTKAPQRLSTSAQAPQKPTDQFLADLAAHSARLESAAPPEIIAWAHATYGDGLTMSTAFGPEGCVLLAMLATIAPQTYVFNLDTGYQFQPEQTTCALICHHPRAKYFVAR